MGGTHWNRGHLLLEGINLREMVFGMIMLFKSHHYDGANVWFFLHVSFGQTDIYQCLAFILFLFVHRLFKPARGSI